MPPKRKREDDDKKISDRERLILQGLRARATPELAHELAQMLGNPNKQRAFLSGVIEVNRRALRDNEARMRSASRDPDSWRLVRHLQQERGKINKIIQKAEEDLENTKDRIPYDGPPGGFFWDDDLSKGPPPPPPSSGAPPSKGGRFRFPKATISI